MAEEINKDLIINFMERIEKKIDALDEDVRSAVLMLNDHDHRLKSLEKNNVESRDGKRYSLMVVMTIISLAIALGSLIVAYVSVKPEQHTQTEIKQETFKN